MRSRTPDEARLVERFTRLAPQQRALILALTDSQVQVLKRLYSTRNELQHASPGVEAGQVFDDVQLLLKTLKRFVTSYVAWLKRHGISLTQ
jgi:molybdopterin biosynthesis enzyme